MERLIEVLNEGLLENNGHLYGGLTGVTRLSDRYVSVNYMHGIKILLKKGSHSYSGDSVDWLSYHHENEDGKSKDFDIVSIDHKYHKSSFHTSSFMEIIMHYMSIGLAEIIPIETNFKIQIVSKFSTNRDHDMYLLVVDNDIDDKIFRTARSYCRDLSIQIFKEIPGYEPKHYLMDSLNLKLEHVKQDAVNAKNVLGFTESIFNAFVSIEGEHKFRIAYKHKKCGEVDSYMSTPGAIPYLTDLTTSLVEAFQNSPILEEVYDPSKYLDVLSFRWEVQYILYYLMYKSTSGSEFPKKWMVTKGTFEEYMKSVGKEELFKKCGYEIS